MIKKVLHIFLVVFATCLVSSAYSFSYDEPVKHLDILSSRMDNLIGDYEENLGYYANLSNYLLGSNLDVYRQELLKDGCGDSYLYKIKFELKEGEFESNLTFVYDFVDEAEGDLKKSDPKLLKKKQSNYFALKELRSNLELYVKNEEKGSVYGLLRKKVVGYIRSLVEEQLQKALGKVSQALASLRSSMGSQKPEWTKLSDKYNPYTKSLDAKNDGDQVVIAEVNFKTPVFGQVKYDLITRNSSLSFQATKKPWLIEKAPVAEEGTPDNYMRVFTLGEKSIKLFMPTGYMPGNPVEPGVVIKSTSTGCYQMVLSKDLKEVEIPLYKIPPKDLNSSLLDIYTRSVGISIGELPEKTRTAVLDKFDPDANHNAEDVAKTVAKHISQDNLYSFDSRPEEDPIKALKAGAFQCDMAAYIMVSILRDVYKIPSRAVAGYCAKKLNESSKQHSYLLTPDNAHAWVEVFFDGGWHYFDPTPGGGDRGDDENKEQEFSDWGPDDLDIEDIIGRLERFQETLKNSLAGLANLSIPALIKLLNKKILLELQALKQGLQGLQQLNPNGLSEAALNGMGSLADFLGSSEDMLNKLSELLKSLGRGAEEVLSKLMEYSESSDVMLEKLQKVLQLFLSFGSQLQLSDEVKEELKNLLKRTGSFLTNDLGSYLLGFVESLLKESLPWLKDGINKILEDPSLSKETQDKLKGLLEVIEGWLEKLSDGAPKFLEERLKQIQEIIPKLMEGLKWLKEKQLEIKFPEGLFGKIQSLLKSLEISEGMLEKLSNLSQSLGEGLESLKEKFAESLEGIFQSFKQMLLQLDMSDATFGRLKGLIGSFDKFVDRLQSINLPEGMKERVSGLVEQVKGMEIFTKLIEQLRQLELPEEFKGKIKEFFGKISEQLEQSELLQQLKDKLAQLDFSEDLKEKMKQLLDQIDEIFEKLFGSLRSLLERIGIFNKWSGIFKALDNEGSEDLREHLEKDGVKEDVEKIKEALEEQRKIQEEIEQLLEEEQLEELLDPKEREKVKALLEKIEKDKDSVQEEEVEEILQEVQPKVQRIMRVKNRIEELEQDNREYQVHRVWLVRKFLDDLPTRSLSMDLQKDIFFLSRDTKSHVGYLLDQYKVEYKLEEGGAAVKLAKVFPEVAADMPEYFLEPGSKNDYRGDKTSTVKPKNKKEEIVGESKVNIPLEVLENREIKDGEEEDESELLLTEIFKVDGLAKCDKDKEEMLGESKVNIPLEVLENREIKDGKEEGENEGEDEGEKEYEGELFPELDKKLKSMLGRDKEKNPLNRMALRNILMYLLNPFQSFLGIRNNISIFESIFKYNQPVRRFLIEGQRFYLGDHKSLSDWFDEVRVDISNSSEIIGGAYQDILRMIKMLKLVRNIFDSDEIKDEASELEGYLAKIIKIINKLDAGPIDESDFVSLFKAGLPPILWEYLKEEYGLDEIGSDIATSSLAEDIRSGRLGDVKLIASLYEHSDFILSPGFKSELKLMIIKELHRESLEKGSDYMLAISPSDWPHAIPTDRRYTKIENIFLRKAYIAGKRKTSYVEYPDPEVKKKKKVRMTIVGYDTSGSMNWGIGPGFTFNDFQAALITAFTCRAIGDDQYEHKVLLIPFDDEIGDSIREINGFQDTFDLIGNYRDRLSNTDGGTDIQKFLTHAMTLIRKAQEDEESMLSLANIVLVTDGIASINYWALRKNYDLLDRDIPLQVMFVAIDGVNEDLIRFVRDVANENNNADDIDDVGPEALYKHFSEKGMRGFLLDSRKRYLNDDEYSAYLLKKFGDIPQDDYRKIKEMSMLAKKSMDRLRGKILSRLGSFKKSSDYLKKFKYRFDNGDIDEYSDRNVQGRLFRFREWIEDESNGIYKNSEMFELIVNYLILNFDDLVGVSLDNLSRSELVELIYLLDRTSFVNN